MSFLLQTAFLLNFFTFFQPTKSPAQNQIFIKYFIKPVSLLNQLLLVQSWVQGWWSSYYYFIILRLLFYMTSTWLETTSFFQALNYISQLVTYFWILHKLWNLTLFTNCFCTLKLKQPNNTHWVHHIGSSNFILNLILLFSGSVFFI